jgi:ABC-type branched-subunit amino acid transport system ATPase component
VQREPAAGCRARRAASTHSTPQRLELDLRPVPGAEDASGTSPPASLSGGQKQMLAVARAMIEPRRLLLIDEPSKGLAPADHRPT